MAINAGPKIVEDGLVFCVDAASKRSYPGAGTTWTDLTANKNNMTLYNSPTFTTENGGAVVFDGTNDYAQNINTNFAQTSNFTAETSLKLNVDLNAGTWVIFSTYDGSNGYQFVWASSSFYFYRGGIQLTTVSLSSTFFSGDILNLVTVWDNSNINNCSIYINNEDKTDTRNSTSASNGTDPLTFNRRGDLMSFPRGHDMYLFRFYNRALSSAEILQNYNATKWRFQ